VNGVTALVRRPASLYRNSRVSLRTVERLSLYRRALIASDRNAATVFSHDLARMCGSTAAQVRRDLMSVGAVGSPSRGYDVVELRRTIDAFLGASVPQPIAVVGVGNLGRALIDYIRRHHDGLKISVAFDEDPGKAGRVVNGVRCYSVADLPRVVAEQQIRIAILAIPEAGAQAMADLLVSSSVRGILNFTPVSLRVAAGIQVVDVDITVALEKLVFSTLAGLENQER
jgi:redox-sensing transcriptional repressor